jgi:hypothetical protein
MKKKTLRMIKLQYMHKAIEPVLEPLMDMAVFGKASVCMERVQTVGTKSTESRSFESANLISASLSGDAGSCWYAPCCVSSAACHYC